MEAQTLLLIYDGECGFCRFGMDVLRRLDSSNVFGFCPFGHPMSEERLSALPSDERYESFHVATADALYSGTAAAREALRALPGGRIAAALGLHHAYPLLARYRWLLGRLVPGTAKVVTCG